MTRRTMVSWVSFLGTVVVLAGVMVGVILTRTPSDGTATAAPAGVMPSGQATKVAQNTERLHVSHAQDAKNEEDETALPPAPPVSPEQAMDVVQKSGQGSGGVANIALTTDATGRSVYAVRTGGPTGVVLDVDAQTGALLGPG